MRVAYEHEFVYSGGNGRDGHMSCARCRAPPWQFRRGFLWALDQCGVEADGYLAEFAHDQFEVTFPPEEPLVACNKAIMVREMARATAMRFGHTVTFTPRVATTGIGNGLHIHMSLWDEAGKPLSHDPKDPMASARPRPSSSPAFSSMPALGLHGADAGFPISAWCRTPGAPPGPISAFAIARRASASARPCHIGAQRGRAIQFRVPSRRRHGQSVYSARGPAAGRSRGLSTESPAPRADAQSGAGQPLGSRAQEARHRGDCRHLGEALAALDADETVQGFRRRASSPPIATSSGPSSTSPRISTATSPAAAILSSFNATRPI